MAAPSVSDRGLILDFTDPRVAADWVPVDDRIMGGSSLSSVLHVDGATQFAGELIVEGESGINPTTASAYTEIDMEAGGFLTVHSYQADGDCAPAATVGAMQIPPPDSISDPANFGKPFQAATGGLANGGIVTLFGSGLLPTQFAGTAETAAGWLYVPIADNGVGVKCPDTGMEACGL